MADKVIGYVRSGLTFILGEVTYNEKEGRFFIEWESSNYREVFGHAATEASARQQLGEHKRRQQRIYARWAGKSNKLLNHAEGQIFKERKCKKKQETSVVKK